MEGQGTGDISEVRFKNSVLKPEIQRCNKMSPRLS